MDPLLTIRDLHLTLPGQRRSLFTPPSPATILRGVDLDIEQAGSVGLVGESGSGKSTIGRALLGLIPTSSGSIHLNRQGELAGSGEREWRNVRQRIQLVFQDPRSSLDPRWRIVDTVAEPLRIAGISRTEAKSRAGDLLTEMGFGTDDFQRFPHEFSGGQRQRIVIARALVLEPELLIADEPVSALDVSIQAQILKLLDDLRRRRKMALLFISHDLGVVRAITETIAVLYAGRVVESGPTEAVFQHPLHPYTKELLAAAPRLDGSATDRAPLTEISEIPAQGCSFFPRCPQPSAECRLDPVLRDVGNGRKVRCGHLPQE